jgi:hypothetical protein
MIRGIKLRKLLEQAMTEGLVPPGAPQGTPPVKGPVAFRRHLHSILGLTENLETHEPMIDLNARTVNAKDFDLAEVARELLPAEFQGLGNVRKAFQLAEQMRPLALAEAEGGAVGASHFAHISAFSDTIGGLIDAIIFEGYQSPEFIGDELVETRDARVQGGYAIGARNDGGVSDNPTLGEPYPTVGLSETRVHIPDNIRNGIALQIREDAFIYDRTGQIQEAAQNAGYSVRRLKELRIADCILGKTNTYSRDNVNSNTYRTATGSTAGASTTKGENGTYPMAYCNHAVSTPLTEWRDLNTAAMTLGGNKDPATGFEIAVRPAESILLVMPHQELLANTILSASGLQTRVTYPVATQSSAVNLDVRNHANPIANFARKVMASWIWYNRLMLAGTNATQAADSAATHVNDATLKVGATTAANAQAVWLWGQFSRAFKYRQIIPFETFQAPLSSEDSRRDIVAVYVSREWGTPWVMEPRYVWMGANTYAA